MDLLLLQPPFWGTTTPPLGLACLKAAATEAGKSAKCLDLNIELYQYAGRKYRDYWHLSQGYNYPEDQEKVLQFYREFYHFIQVYKKKIYEWMPKEIWITVQSSSSLFTSLLVSELKKDFEIYLGGPQIWEFVQAREFVLKLFPMIADYISGEGEELFHGRLGPIRDLDKLPFPDFTDFDLYKYNYSYSLPIYISRGCVNKCIYCSERGLHGGFFRSRSGERVFDDLQYQLNVHPKVYFFHFVSSAINGDMDALGEFCDRMILSGLNEKVKWSAGSCIIRKEMRSAFYKKMKKAGCTFISYGPETAVPRLWKSIGKNAAVGADLSVIVKEAYEVGIKVSLNFMFGLPGETEEDFQQTLGFVKDHRKYIYEINPSLNLCGFFPGSEGYKHPEKYGLSLAQHPVLWESGDNTYEVRKDRFLRFNELARKLKLRNFFGDVRELPPPTNRVLYYQPGINLMLSKISLWWSLKRLWAVLWLAIKRDFKHRLRRFYYLRIL